MNGLEWMFSAVLTVVFLVTGYVKVFRYDVARNRLAWVRDVPRALTQFSGVAEILGAAGLILPVATGFLPWLTPLAAAALGLLMVMATVFHWLRREGSEALLSMFILAMLGSVAYIRWLQLQ